ncbi:hypothetical protein F946_00942 [Acinetobacter johnsonii ANC 3681]|uniref:Uncharacterized protein n=1 Tax=Acinetobacter johnsonii ANC 3681 TaxID=1217662 RepID=N9CYC8_ACIJO|nr:hypothetical protein [Acinetobacter johnsonii]ENV73430.1 hypothetical protein F946_00942 [Acinetobacter johnsonii ANC 3681]
MKTIINKKKVGTYGVGAVLSTSVLATNANAALDVAAALAGNSTEDNIGLVVAFMLGVAVLIWGSRKVVGFFSK